jgi:hypothetical protein
VFTVYDAEAVEEAGVKVAYWQSFVITRLKLIWAFRLPDT